MNPKILLIEDDNDIRLLYKRQLDAANLSTDGVGTGKEGLEKIAQNHYDLILLDLLLPDINGLVVLKQLKEGENSKNIPVVILTNLSQEPVIKQGLEMGAHSYLIKASYTPNQIVQEVQKVLDDAKKTAS